MNLNDDVDQRLIIQNKCQSQTECSICYETFYSRQVVLLPCKHMFHNSCFKKTLDHQSYKCALCRFDITAALGKTGFKFPPGAGAGLNTTVIAYTNTVDFATLFAFTEFDFMPNLISDDSDDDTTDTNTTDTNTTYTDTDTTDTDTNTTETDTNTTDMNTTDTYTVSDDVIDSQLQENFWTNILLHMNISSEQQPDTSVAGSAFDERDISYNTTLLYFYL